jgi:hypothetical protein
MKNRLSLALLALAAAAVLVAALAFRFGPEKLHAKLTSPRWVLELSTAMLIKAAELSQRAQISIGIDSTRIDEALLALHDIGKRENSTAVYNFSIYHIYHDIWSERRKQSPAPVLLELGPGSNLGQGVIFVMTGAKKYYGLDIYRPLQFYNRAPYQAVAALLSTVAPEAIVSNVDSVFRIDGDKVVFIPRRWNIFIRTSLTIFLYRLDQLIIVFSHSVFEHISDPEATINAIFRLLPSGGLTAHHFDMRDHDNFSGRWNFSN